MLKYTCDLDDKNSKYYINIELDLTEYALQMTREIQNCIEQILYAKTKQGKPNGQQQPAKR